MVSDVRLTKTELDVLSAYGVEELAVWDENVTNIITLNHLVEYGENIPQSVLDFVNNANSNNSSAQINYDDRPSFYSENPSEERTTSSSFRTSHSDTFPVEAGKSYTVSWNYECSNIKNRQIKVRVYIDGVLIQDLNFRSNFRYNNAYYGSVGGFYKYDATENKDVPFDLQFAAERSGNEVRIKNVKLYVKQENFV